MKKSYVITERSKLDAFLRRCGRVDDMGMIVGQLSGKPKYPRGHVGRRSREPGRRPTNTIKRAELDRRAQIRAARKTLEGLDASSRRATIKELRAAFKMSGQSSRGLGRRRSAATPVARVAGVLAAQDQYHLRAIDRRRVAMQKELDAVMAAMLGRGGSITDRIITVGRNSVAAIRRSFAATGHVDTGRLLRNINYEFFSVSGKAAVKRAEKAARDLRRAAKKGRR